MRVKRAERGKKGGEKGVERELNGGRKGVKWIFTLVMVIFPYYNQQLLLVLILFLYLSLFGILTIYLIIINFINRLKKYNLIPE